MSTFSLAAHSWQSFVKVSLAPGTQWSQKPTESLPAAKAPRTKGDASAVVAAVCKSVRRVSRVFPIRASHGCRGGGTRRGRCTEQPHLILAQVAFAIYTHIKPSSCAGSMTSLPSDPPGPGLTRTALTVFAVSGCRGLIGLILDAQTAEFLTGYRVFVSIIKYVTRIDEKYQILT